MNSTEVKLALGALLCSIGKLYYRGSLISAEEYGYTALNSIVKISDPDILNTVRYHKLSDKFKDFLNHILDKDYITRLSIKEALEHPWIKAFDILDEEKQNISNQENFLIKLITDAIPKFNQYIK